MSVIVVIAAMGLTGVALSATSAGATAPSVSGVCKTLTNVSINPSSDPTANGGKSNALKLSKKFSDAAKKSKGDIKKTLTTLSNYFKALGKGDINAIQNQAQAFGAAAANFASYVATNCIGGGNLPNGVTIPTVPH